MLWAEHFNLLRSNKRSAVILPILINKTNIPLNYYYYLPVFINVDKQVNL